MCPPPMAGEWRSAPRGEGDRDVMAPPHQSAMKNGGDQRPEVKGIETRPDLGRTSPPNPCRPAPRGDGDRHAMPQPHPPTMDICGDQRPEVKGIETRPSLGRISQPDPWRSAPRGEGDRDSWPEVGCRSRPLQVEISAPR